MRNALMDLDSKHCMMIFNVIVLLAIIISSTNGGLAESDPAFLLECRIPRNSAASLNNQSIVDAESVLLSQIKDDEEETVLIFIYVRQSMLFPASCL